MTVAIAALLTITVLAAWLATFGLARLASPLDRLHCVSFASIAVGLPLAAAAFLADGVSSRSLKLLLLVLLLPLCGAALTHATGRAIAVRGAAGEPE